MSGRVRDEGCRRGDDLASRYGREHSSRRERYEQDDRHSRSGEPRPGSSGVSDWEQPEYPIQVVQPTKSDRSSRCTVCIRKVPNYLEHANARHLPWFVVGQTACGACYTQFNTRPLLLAHFDQSHGGRNYRMDPRQWAACMTEFFQIIADSLHISLSSIPSFVRERKLAVRANGRKKNRENVFVNPENEMYVNEPSLPGREPYDPSAARSLRDCVHWKIVMRLIAETGGVICLSLVRSVDPRLGYFYYPESSEDRQEQRDNKHIRRPPGLASGSQRAPVKESHHSTSAPVVASHHDFRPQEPAYSAPSSSREFSSVEEALVSEIVNAVASGAIMPNELPPDIENMLAELVRKGNNANPSIIQALASRTTGIQGFKDISFHSLQPEATNRLSRHRPSEWDDRSDEAPPTKKPVRKPEQRNHELRRDTYDRSEERIHELRHETYDRPIERDDPMIRPSHSKAAPRIDERVHESRRDAYGYDPREDRIDEIDYRSRREPERERVYVEEVSRHSSGRYESSNGRDSDRYREHRAPEQLKLDPRYSRDEYARRDVAKKEEADKYLSKADILAAIDDRLPPRESEVYRYDVNHDRTDYDRQRQEIPRHEMQRYPGHESIRDQRHLDTLERPGILPTPEPRRHTEPRVDEYDRVRAAVEDVSKSLGSSLEAADFRQALLPTPASKRPPPDPTSAYNHQSGKRPALLDHRSAIPAEDYSHRKYTEGTNYRSSEEGPTISLDPSRRDAPRAKPSIPQVPPPSTARPGAEPNTDVREMRKQLQTLSQGMAVLTDAIMHMNHINK